MKIAERWYRVRSLGIALWLIGNLNMVIAEGSRPSAAAKSQSDSAPAELESDSPDVYRDLLEVKDDAEWKVISGRIEKVTKAKHELKTTASHTAHELLRRSRNRKAKSKGKGGKHVTVEVSATPLSPEEERLQTAVDVNVSKAEIKAALIKFQNAREAKQARLDKVKAELREVLTVRQEAIASLSGLL